MRKQTISFLLSLALLLSLFPAMTLGAAAGTSGYAGDNVTWTLDKEAGVLAFEGVGEISFLYAYNLVWWEDGESIRELRFSDGITGICDGAFSVNEFASYSQMQRMRNLRTVLIPATIERIGSYAFFSCTRLDEITVLNPDCEIGENPRSLGDPDRTVVVGYPGSTAEAYAGQYGYTFRAIRCEDGSHVYRDTVLMPQTCTEDGLQESECLVCGYKTQRPIPASHNYVLSDRLAQTAYTCTRCGDSYVTGECTVLDLDESASFTVNAEAYPCVRFTPEQTDRYYIWMDQLSAVYQYDYCYWPGEFYDSEGRRISSDTNRAILEAGKTYYYLIPQAYDNALTVQAGVEVDHEYVRTETEATCTQGGEGTYTCVYCGDYYRSYDDPLGHDYSEEIITAPSCTQQGLAKYTCARCGESYTEVLPVRHSYVFDIDLPWYRHAVCSLCGEESVYGTPEPPALTLDETVTGPFDENGQCCFRFTPRMAEYYSLSFSGGYNVEARLYDSNGYWIDSCYSSYGFDFSFNSAMYAGQVYYYVFTNYGDSGDTFSATMSVRHDYSYDVTIPPSCTSEGLATLTCRFCGDSYTEAIPESHEWRYDVERPWYQHAVCRLCGKEQDFGTLTPPALTPGEEFLPEYDEDSFAWYSFTPEVGDLYYLHFTDFEYSDTYFSVYASDGDYLEGGWREYTAFLDAGQTYYFMLHTYDGPDDPHSLVLEQRHEYVYTMFKYPTCTEEGLWVGACIHCNATVTEVIPLEHEYAFDVLLPWYRFGICWRCGETYEDGDPLPPELTLEKAAGVHVGEPEGTEFFRFTPEKTGRYVFLSSDNANVCCEVYSASGNSLWRFGAENASSYLGTDCVMLAGCTYYLEFGYYYMDETGDFSVTLRLLEEVEEPALKLDESTYARPDPQNLMRYFRFTPEQTGYYEFFADPVQNGYISGQLYDTDGAAVDSYYNSSNQAFRFRCRLNAGQTYHLRTSYEYYEGSPRGYNVSVRKVPGLIDAIELVLDLKNGITEQTVTATTSYDVPRINYCFTSEESAWYELYANSGEDTICFVYDSEMNWILTSDDVLTLDFDLLLYIPAGETYFFSVGYYDIREGSFPVTLKYYRTPELPGEPLAPGERTEAAVSGEYQPVYFTFTPEQTDVYAFSSFAGTDTFCSLNDGVEHHVGEDDDSGENGNFRLETVLQAGQQYQFVVSYNSEQTGSFPVLLEQVHDYHAAPAAPTCTEPGGIVFTCSYCGDSYLENRVEPLGHEFGEWAVKKAAACTEAGEESRVCARCGEEETRDVAALGHDWGEAVYAWSENNGEVIATHACRRDPSHTETETVKTVSRVTKEATAEAEGEMTVTASFTNAAFAAQSKTVAIPKSVPDKPAKEFTDMPAPGHWAHDAIAWAVEKGVTTGTSETTFSPDSGCTRAQVVTFLWRAAGKPEPKSAVNPFTDVASDAYYRDAVLWALGEGITTGTSDTKFSPNAVCTRAQIVTFLWRFSGSKEAEKAASFSDVVPGAYYEKAVSWAAETGVTTGTSDTTFSPNSTCTRAQVVTFLYRDIVKNAG